MPTGTTEHLGKSVVRSVQNLTSTSPRGRRRKSTERALWARVLRIGILDALGHAPLGLKEGKKRLMDDAVQWIQSNQDGPGSFRWTCSLFNLSPAAVREQIEAEAHRRRIDKGRPMARRMKYWSGNRRRKSAIR